MTPGAPTCCWCGKVNLSKDWGAHCSEECWDADDADLQANWQRYWDAGEKFVTTSHDEP